jgi:hypothetical protein
MFRDDAPLPTLARNECLVQRYVQSEEFTDALGRIQRGEITDANQQWAEVFANISRAITSGMTAFPTRENLDADIHVLSPIETPLRNLIPRTPGAGTAAQWRVQTAFGTGLGTLTTTVGTSNTTSTIVVDNTRGFFAGETILFNGTQYTIASITNATTITVVGTPLTANSQTAGLSVIKTSFYYPESGANSRVFFAEDGAPVERTTVYANRSTPYRLIGDMGGVTGFAMASGANFMDQYAREKVNVLKRALMLEERALLFSESATTAVPWGDGTTALGYQGLRPFILASSPANHIQTSVGALTLAHVEAQIQRIQQNGGRNIVVMVNAQEAISLSRLITASGNWRPVIEGTLANATVGLAVTKFISAVSSETIDIVRHPLMPVGEMIFAAQNNVEGQPNWEVSVLEQVQRPETAFGNRVEGYFAQEIAPGVASPQVFRFMVSVYSVPKWKDGRYFAISQGVTAAA